MALAPISQITGTVVPVPGDDIDTDRIIPARFMKCVTFDGLGEFAFYDVRVDPESGEKTNHPLNDERYAGATILLSGVNFGCGSSREHAPQSLAKYGFKAIVAGSFAEIFFGNSTTLGLPCVTASASDRERLSQAIQADPALKITLDLEKMQLTAGEHIIPVEMPHSARQALLSGKYDPIQELIEHQEEVQRVANTIGYTV